MAILKKSSYTYILDGNRLIIYNDGEGRHPQSVMVANVQIGTIQERIEFTKPHYITITRQIDTEVWDVQDPANPKRVKSTQSN